MNLISDTAGPAEGEERRTIVQRLLQLYRTHTTDLADTQWFEPASNYCDNDLWHRECSNIHRRVPLPLALSCELPLPLSWKATSVIGLPVLITRDADGTPHASINVCRHRGARLATEGRGELSHFVCPFHGWSYDSSGRLSSTSVSSTFGPLPQGDRNLIALPIAEVCGLIFVSLNPGNNMEIKHWLDRDLICLLDQLQLGTYHHYSERQVEGPNWKLVIDGYLESYHVGTLHAESVLPNVLSDIATFDSWGPHQRNSFALQSIKFAAASGKEDQDPQGVAREVFWLFPGLNISGGGSDAVAVSLVLPGRSVDHSVTTQHVLIRSEPKTSTERAMADRVRDALYSIAVREDYAVATGIQEGLAAMGSTPFVFGRNEPGVQHFHRSIDHHRQPASAALSDTDGDPG